MHKQSSSRSHRYTLVGLLLWLMLAAAPLQALPPGDIDPDPDPDPGNELPATASIFVERAGNEKVLYGTNAVKVRWLDNSWDEEGFIVYRRLASDTNWTRIRSFEARAQSGTVNEFIDANLAYDTSYCYRIDTYNANGTVTSPRPPCTKTSISGINPPHIRAQLLVEVGSHGGDDEGTSDYLSVRLAQKGDTGHNNQTWVNPPPSATGIEALLPGRFKKGSSRIYDLNFFGTTYVGDINMFQLGKTGDDGICIKTLALIINGVELFRHPMRDTGYDCKWFDPNSGDFNVIYDVSKQGLRNGTGWSQLRSNLYVKHSANNQHVHETGYRFPFRSWVYRDELETRLEGYVGHFLKDSQIYWDGDNDRRNIEIKLLDEQQAIFEVDFDLQVNLNNLPDPWLDVDFKLDYDVECVAGPSGQASPYGPDSMLRLNARMYDFHKDIPTWAEWAPNLLFWAWIAFDFVTGERIDNFGSYWEPDDVAMDDFLEKYASHFTQQVDIPYLCDGLYAPPVGVDIATNATELVPWLGTQPEPFPDGDLDGNFALKLWADREDLNTIIAAYLRCNPLFGGSPASCNDDGQPQPEPDPEADLYLDMRGASSSTRAGPSETDENGNITFETIIRNRGPNPAENAVLTIEMPPLVTLVSAEEACSLAGTLLTCPMGTIQKRPFGADNIYPVAEDAVVHVVVHQQKKQGVQFVARISSDTHDPRSANNVYYSTFGGAWGWLMLCLSGLLLLRCRSGMGNRLKLNNEV